MRGNIKIDPPFSCFSSQIAVPLLRRHTTTIPSPTLPQSNLNPDATGRHAKLQLFTRCFDSWVTKADLPISCFTSSMIASALALLRLDPVFETSSSILDKNWVEKLRSCR